MPRFTVRSLCAVSILVCLLCFAVAFGVRGAWLLRQDYVRFWTVGEHLLLAAAPGLAPLDAAALARRFPLDLMSPAAGVQAWLYPPTLNSLAMLLALLPLRASYAVWNAGSLLLAAWLLRRAGLGWPVLLLGLAGPADLFSLAGGQTGTLLGALLVSALATADERPLFAGLCAGGLALKPQLGLALIAILPQRLRLFGVSLAGAAALVLLSLVLQGVGPWAWFFRVAGPTGTRIISGPWGLIFADWSISVFIMARSFGAGLPLAWVLQGMTAAIALILIALAWRNPAADPWRRLAFTVSLSVLVMPYGFLYDMTGFGIAMAVMWRRGPPALRPLFALFWLASGFSFEACDGLGHPIFPLVAAAAAWACRPAPDASLARLWRRPALR